MTDGRSLSTIAYTYVLGLCAGLILNTLIASMAYSTWKILPSGENVLTPLHMNHAHDNEFYPEIMHTTRLYTTHQTI